jgi:hypothetical protein
VDNSAFSSAHCTRKTAETDRRARADASLRRFKLELLADDGRRLGWNHVGSMAPDDQVKRSRGASDRTVSNALRKTEGEIHRIPPSAFRRAEDARGNALNTLNASLPSGPAVKGCFPRPEPDSARTAPSLYPCCR